MGRLDGRVAFITGGARGQGRAISERLASDGADIARDIDSLEYSLSNDTDAAEAIALVEQHGQRCVALQADVRKALWSSLECRVAHRDRRADQRSPRKSEPGCRQT